MKKIAILFGSLLLSLSLLFTACGTSDEGGTDGGGSDAGQDGASGTDEDAEAEAQVRANLPTPEQVYQDLAASLDLRHHLWGDATDENLSKLQLVGGLPVTCSSGDPMNIDLPAAWNNLPSGRYLLTSLCADGTIYSYFYDNDFDNMPLDFALLQGMDDYMDYSYEVLDLFYFCAGGNWGQLGQSCIHYGCKDDPGPDYLLLYYAEYASDQVCQSEHREGEGCKTSSSACADAFSCRNNTCGGSCTPNCTGKECGSDGCGGTCGQCQNYEDCINGECVDDCPAGCRVGSVCCGGAFCSGDCIGTPCCT